MKKLTIRLVFNQLPRTFLYFIIGSLLGTLTGYILFYTNRELFEFVLTVWRKRIMLGVSFGAQPTFWFILNNIIALSLVVVASILILLHISKTPTYLFTKKFRRFEKHRPKITLFGLYIIPVGALLVNSFLLSLFAMYVLLNFSFEKFVEVAYLLVPHGINELIALLLASSLGLSYLQILSPLILSKRWKKCVEVGKSLLRSNVTLFFVAVIAILIVFSGFLEGLLGLFAIG